MTSEAKQAVILAMLDRAEQEENGLEDDLDSLIGLLDDPRKLQQLTKEELKPKVSPSPFRGKGLTDYRVKSEFPRKKHGER